MIMTGISYFALLTRFVAMPRWNEIRNLSRHTSPANGTGTRSNDRLRVRRVVISRDVLIASACAVPGVDSHGQDGGSAPSLRRQ